MENWFERNRAALVQCTLATLREHAALNRSGLPPFQLPQVAERLIAGLSDFVDGRGAQGALKVGTDLGRRGLALRALQAVDRVLIREAHGRAVSVEQLILVDEYLSEVTCALVEGENDELRRQRDGIQATLERTLRSVEDEMRQLIQELSTPIMPIHDGILVLPLIGQIDEERARRITERLLSAITAHAATLVIIDITGVPSMNQEVAAGLIRTARAAQFLGVKVLLVGIRPDIARTLTELDIDMVGLITLANLRSGIEHALRERGLTVRRERSAPRTRAT